MFKVSSKVTINSGPFSFFLEHNPGDLGIGMITPVYYDPGGILEEPLMRMTLTLLDGLNREELKKSISRPAWDSFVVSGEAQENNH
jgi:hypothetical protein